MSSRRSGSMGCTPTHPPHTVPGYRPPLSADRGEAHSMTTQQGSSGPCRCPPWGMLGNAGARAGDWLGIPTRLRRTRAKPTNTTTTDRGRESAEQPEQAGPAECCRWWCWCCAPLSVVDQGRRPPAGADSGCKEDAGQRPRLSAHWSVQNIRSPASGIYCVSPS